MPDSWLGMERLAAKVLHWLPLGLQLLWDGLCHSRSSLSQPLACIITAIAPLRWQLFADPRVEEGQSPKGLLGAIWSLLILQKADVIC